MSTSSVFLHHEYNEETKKDFFLEILFTKSVSKKLKEKNFYTFKLTRSTALIEAFSSLYIGGGYGQGNTG